MTDYDQFLERKRFSLADAGKSVHKDELHPQSFPHQKAITQWALRKGRAAVFADTGLGKSLIELDWARHATDRSILFAPLAVAKQTVREASKFGIDAVYARSEEEAPKSGIVTANYEMMQYFDPKRYGAVVFDESSILKSYTSKTRDACIEFAQPIAYRLPATATPAPNDFMELGNHAELLGVMSRQEMLSMFFVHDGANIAGGRTSGGWRLKGHAEEEFFKWLATWAVTIRKPSDFGYDDDLYNLPPLNIHHHCIETSQSSTDSLFSGEALTLTEQRKSKRGSLGVRVERMAELANSNDEQWVVWCELNDEGDALTKAISGAVQVSGSDKMEKKEQAILDFIDGKFRALVSKPSIFGHGLNLQNCHNTGFVGPSHSYEQFYQAVRRFWRFGQESPVNCHRVYADTEAAIIRNVDRKGKDADRMANAMICQMQAASEIMSTRRETTPYAPMVEMRVPAWLM